ncbi:hypothetical protein O1611_g6878 [Lasiodiplodia mahajangana]|uniref:Uncharacterized protein n=1 Tax=Lasiodiplodia mahajangana TaxID=1108764 RepID=A0ACC2JH50_9PEZI|nr:hypothetical protein O1611_g6878 [Lasiodiplodia mahajangana]
MVLFRKKRGMRRTLLFDSVPVLSLDEILKAAADSNVSLKSTPHQSDGEHCPFKTRHGHSIFEYYTHHPEYAGRFAQAMAGVTRTCEVDREVTQLRDCFPWNDLDGVVVDVGGGSGHLSLALARVSCTQLSTHSRYKVTLSKRGTKTKLFPRLSFVIQDDSATMLAEGEKLITDDIRNRISFARHNFFQPQPYRNAAAFLLRQCTHDWCDRDVVTMFKSLVPGMEGSKPNTPLLINDIIMPQPGAWSRHAERGVRDLDMMMMIGFGSKERTRDEFEALLKEADSRYEIRNVYATGPMGLLEVYLK